MKRFTILLLFSCLTFWSGVALAQNAEKEEAAVQTATKWLALVDQEQYAKSWQEAAAYFKNNVSQAKWDSSMRAVRSPLGKLVRREILGKSYTTALPGAPDGEYVMIQFKTSFSNKRSAVETITPMLDNDGQWRVTGYYIK